MNNCYTFDHRRTLVPSIAMASERGITLGTRRINERTIREARFTVRFHPDKPPSHERDRLLLAEPVLYGPLRIIMLRACETTETSGLLVRTIASEVQINADWGSKYVAKVTWHGRRGTHRRPKIDALIWMRPNNKALVNFGSLRHRVWLKNSGCQLVCEPYSP